MAEDNILGKWASEFKSKGLSDLTDAIHEFEAATVAATDKHVSLSKVISDETFQKAGTDLRAAREQTQQLISVESQRISLAYRLNAVKSGNYANEIRALGQLAKEREKIEKLEKRAGLVQKYGKVGGAIAYHADTKAAKALGGVAAVAAGSIVASAKSGFSGTVEGNRLALEFKLISRELAGAFKPAIDLVTRSLQNFRMWLEKLSPGGQARLMLGAGGVAAYVGANMLKRSLVSLGILGAAKVGETVGGAVGGGAAAWGKNLVRASVLPAITTTLGINREAMAGAAAIGGTTAAIAGKSILKGASKLALPFAIAEVIKESTTGGYYSAIRGRGENKATAMMGAIGGAAMDFVTFGGYGESFRKKYAQDVRDGEAGGPGKGKREKTMPTIADAGFESAGSAYERVTNALSLTDANTDQRDILTQIRDIIMKALDMDKVPDPPEMRA